MVLNKTITACKEPLKNHTFLECSFVSTHTEISLVNSTYNLSVIKPQIYDNSEGLTW